MSSFADFAGLINQINGESVDLEPFINEHTLRRLVLDVDAALDLYVAASIKEVPPGPRGQFPDRGGVAGGGPGLARPTLI